MKKTVFGIIALLVLLGAAAGYFFLTDGEKPLVTLLPDSPKVSPKREYIVEAADSGSGIRAISVMVVQGDKRITVLDKTFSPSPPQAGEAFTLEGAGLKDGPFEMVITATDNSIHEFGGGNVTEVHKTLTLDSIPPVVGILSQAHNVRQGGVGCIAYSVSEDTESTGIVVGDLFAPGFKLPNGHYACLFPFPVTMEPADFKPRLKAVDMAGNERIVDFRHQAVARKFKADTMNVSDSFLQSKMPQFFEFYPGMNDLLQLYVTVNNDLRRENAKTLRELAAKTAPELLWDKKSFLRLPNAAPMAGFGDRRTYVYQGREIDKQTHMGVDLASLENAQVPAAAGGKVAYAGFFGIYGQAVVLDHGLGLQTIYSHLSQIAVKEGDQVKRGDILGNTGATGLAGGDHLHFGVMVHGIEVSPIEWWDQHWIDDNVADRFK
ncbi:M23 family metallopeptidase [Desulfolutivibrio sulfoxidireducens]|uniref:M23 family metallopeptidase n=1 Tax=Desulfolutivibrio sulfoxidireducens TaxID=2773299 RepID=UPI00159DB6FF|nr:M23 family metallopeptidase [Desulfolutivibrio sulfoxidireducens]QLA16203.1 peptidoglycan DD-metalloendopeptidase family protein [Desulfolutivibrio sulfoxidireducens]QLA19899.1 peptidoglycan DD-metalloendopeptidase family protein [Desulfolutivibrio sulfoxidireducens]